MLRAGPPPRRPEKSITGGLVTEAQLAQIEEALGVTLPAHYRAFMLALPPSVQEIRDARGEDWEQDCITDQELLVDPAKLIKLNTDIRRRRSWPREYYVIGEEGNGNLWAIELVPTADPPAVFMWDHEEAEILCDPHHRMGATSLDDYLAGLVEIRTGGR